MYKRQPYANAEETERSSKGKVIDLVLPVVVLVICCVIGMIYTGGFFSGESFVSSFANSDASAGLVYGSISVSYTHLDGGVDLHHGGVHIGAVGKLQHHQTVVLRTGAGHIFDAGYRPQCTLHGLSLIHI